VGRRSKECLWDAGIRRRAGIPHRYSDSGFRELLEVDRDALAHGANEAWLSVRNDLRAIFPLV
jgi:hypothetical protein